MGKGKTPCCDKSQVKRGPWSPAEDLKLVTFIQKHGHENWRALPKQAGLLRCGKSCRLRWTNYLRPDVKRGNFTKEEEDIIIKLHQTLGNKWSKISSYLSGRTDNEIKNVWNTHLKKRLVKNGDYDRDELKESSITTTISSSSSSFTLIISGNEMDLDVEIDQQGNQGSLTKKISITETETTMENSERKLLTKEFSSPSISSHSSNLMTDYSQVDVSKPEEDDQIGKILSDFIAQYDVQNALDEVNKLENIGINLLEIPLESDFDFWNMLDTLNSSQSKNEGYDQLQSSNHVSHESSKLEKACINEEDENKKWLRYLKTELGLDTTEDGSEENLFEDNSIDHYQSLTSENFDQYDDVPYRPKT